VSLPIVWARGVYGSAPAQRIRRATTMTLLVLVSLCSYAHVTRTRRSGTVLSDAQDGSELADFGDNATRSIVYVDARAAVTHTWSPTRASFKFLNGQMW
jgi:hypothetical protein